MPGVFEDQDRKIIPRWREFRRTIEQGELAYPATKPAQSPCTEEFERRLVDWQLNNGIAFAGDLISCAVILGRAEDVKDAAHFLVQQADSVPPCLLGLAGKVFDPPSASAPTRMPSSFDHALLRERIHALRNRLRKDPRDSISWVDQSLAYTSLGFPAQALAATEMALRLAPSNRFVLRAAARLLVHNDDYGRAHDVLSSCDRTKADPWLLAAEIAAAPIAGRTSRLTRTAARLISEARFPPLHLSELASALATMEFAAGKRKAGRDYLKVSLADPTENAIAQAAWLARKERIGDLLVTNQMVRRSAEAAAHGLFAAGNWRGAKSMALEWLDDQPFSSRPVILASYVASVCLEDYVMAIRLAKHGMNANPESFAIVNNYAFASALAGCPTQGLSAFARINGEALSPSDRIVWLATSGLLQYRVGNIEGARQLYRAAIDDAHRQQDRKRRALALLFQTLEELRLGATAAQSLRAEALDAASAVPDADVQEVVKRVGK